MLIQNERTHWFTAWTLQCVCTGYCESWILFIGNHSQKKTFTNFVDFRMITNVFLLPFSIFLKLSCYKHALSITTTIWLHCWNISNVKRVKTTWYLIWAHGPQSEMVPSMLIKEPGCQTRSRLTEKLAKVQKTHVHHAIWQYQKKSK